MNEIFLYAGDVDGNQHISIGVGSRGHQRRRQLTENEALKLAHKLMFYARGGSTNGRVIPLSEL
jgi:hypothetical protein